MLHPDEQEMKWSGEKTALMNEEFLSLLLCEQKIHRKWKQGQATWNEYWEVIRVNRNKTRKDKAHLELNLAKAVKDSKKSLSNTSVTKGKLKIMWAITKWREDPGNRGNRENSYWIFSLHWASLTRQPSGITDPGDQDKGISKKEDFFLG